MKICGGLEVLNMLGMARRAGALAVGQDKVLAALKGGGRFVVFLTNDCSANVSRRVRAAEERGEAEIILLKDAAREALGASLGVKAAQTAALPAESGFMKKIYTLTYDRSDANE